MSAPVVVQPSTGRVLARTWRSWTVVVVGNALVQGLLVLGDPMATTSWAFAARVLVSAAAVLLTVAFLVAVARSGALGARTGRPSGALLGWTTGLGVLVGAVAVVYPWVVPVLLVLGVVPLTAVAERAPLGYGAGPLRHPRPALTVVAFVLLATLGWPVALVLGFFVTGPVAAAATWLWFGLTAALIATNWAVTCRRRVG